MNDINLINVRDNEGNIIQIESLECVASTVEIARERAMSGVTDRYVVFSPKRLKPKTKSAKSSADLKTENGVFMSLILRPLFSPHRHPC